MRRWIEKARSADSWVSLLQWPKSIVELVFPTAISTGLSLILSALSSYGLFEFIITFLVFTISILAIWALIIFIYERKSACTKQKKEPETKNTCSISTPPDEEKLFPKQHHSTFDQNEIENLEKIYHLDDSNGKSEIRLRFLPDTDDHESDALLVICLVYKHVRGMQKIKVNFVNWHVSNLILKAPNARPFTPAAAIRAFADQSKDFGKRPISFGYIEGVDLAQGGSYRLTPSGEEHARAIAIDMINRA